MRLSFNHLKWELKTNASLFVFHNFSHVLVHNFVFNGILFYPFFISFMNMILWINLHIRTVVHLHRINHLCTLIFVCLVFYIPLKNFSLIWKRYHYRWRATNLTYAIEQWGFFSAQHWLWHFRRPMTLTLVAKCLVVELSLPVLTT